MDSQKSLTRPERSHLGIPNYPIMITHIHIASEDNGANVMEIHFVIIML